MIKIYCTVALVIASFLSLAQTVCEREVTTFGTSSGGYTVTGSAILKDSLGVLRLSLSSNFFTANGPDLYLYLSIRDQAPTVAGNRNVQVAKLRSNSGAQTYVVPGNVGIDDYDFVTIHCKAFNSFWDGGTLNAKVCRNLQTNDTITRIACGEYVSPSKKYTWKNSGTYMDTLKGKNSKGGDSVLTINLTVNTVNANVTDSGLTLIANDSTATYQWLDCTTMLPIIGDTNRRFTSSVNGFFAVIVSKNGCSDTSKCVPIITKASHASISDTVCFSYTSPSGKYVWTQTGNYVDTLIGANAGGSDSIISISLTINEVDTSIGYSNLVFTAHAVNAGFQWLDCNSNQVIPGATTRDYIPNKTGDYAAIVTQNGCTDTTKCYTISSIANDSSIHAMQCFSYSSPSGKYSWTTSGTYVDTLVGKNIAGGDSILTIHLTIHTIDTSTVDSMGTIIANAVGGGVFYQWYDCTKMELIANANERRYTAEKDGDYAVILLQNNCLDTSRCHKVTLDTMSVDSALGLKPLEFNVGLKAYPNPTSSFVRLTFDQSLELGEVMVKVLDVTGEVVFSMALEDTEDHVELDLSDRVNGMYFIEVQTTRGKNVIRVLKN